MPFLLQRSFLLSALAAILSGLMIACGFPGIITANEGMGWFMPFALVPLFVAMENLPTTQYVNRHTYARSLQISGVQRSVAAMILAWITGITVWSIGFFWTTTAAILFGKLPIPATYGGYAIAAVLMGLYFPLLLSPFVVNAGRGARKHTAPFPLLAMVIVSVSIERWGPSFFSWSLGGLLHNSNALNQWIALMGVSAMSGFILFSNAVLARSLTSHPRSLVRFAVSTGLLIVFWGLVYGIGESRMYETAMRIDRTTRIGFIQPNFTFSELSSNPRRLPKSMDQSLDFLIRMTRKLVEDNAARKPELLVWPESVVPSDFTWNQHYKEQTKAFVKEIQIPLLVQAVEFDEKEFQEKGFRDTTTYGASFIVRPDGSQSASFRKWSPIPFGESIPFEDRFPGFARFLRNNIGNLSKVGRGTNWDAIPYTPDFYVAPLICFDASDSELTRMQTLKGNASIFINQANFVWMADSNAGLEFAQLARFRAIENGRSLLLASNSGPSVAFDPVGRPIMPMTDRLTSAAAIVELPIFADQTFYTQFGDVPLAFCGVISALVLAFALVRRSR